ncbi:MAG: hypothetical protein HRU04_25080 [Oceanospirillaceae bacterium]|nr:hypothetical protein [Oceanospirillaceae bacterium]
MKFLLNHIRLILLFIALFAVTGCSTKTAIKHTATENFNGIHIYSTTSDMQSSFLKDRSSNEHFCDARASDVADSESEGFGLSAAFIDQQESFGESSSHGAITLGGRSPAVLITREVMYRTCEMIMNLNLDKEEALDLYMKTLNLISVVVKNDANNGSASISGSAQEQNVYLIESKEPTGDAD